MLKGSQSKATKGSKTKSPIGGKPKSLHTKAKAVKPKQTTTTHHNSTTTPAPTPVQSLSTQPFSTTQHASTTTTKDIVADYLNDPAISKRLPPNLKQPIKGSLLNRTPPRSTGQTLRNINTQLSMVGIQNSADIYEDFIVDKHGDKASLHIEENLYDTSKMALQSTIVKKPIQQLQPLINVLLPKDSPLDEYSYLRIRKMAKTNPDLIAMNESKINSRLQQLSKIVLHPHFYREYAQRYVFKKHGVPLQPPEHSVMTNHMTAYIKKKTADLAQGINNPHPVMEQSIREYKKLHQYPYHPLVLHVFEKYPLILRRKHIDNTPQLIQNIFTTIQSESGTDNLYKDIGDYDDDVGFAPANQHKIMSNQDQYDEDFSEDFNSSRITFEDGGEGSEMQYDPASNSMKHVTGAKGKNNHVNKSNATTTASTSSQTHEVTIDAHQILGRFPKLLEFDLTNRIHDKINAFTTIICAFLAQDDPNHNNLYTREDIANAQQVVLHFIISQPDILQANVHNIIPKRLNFIQKACLFDSAAETLQYIAQHPRLMSPTINPSNIQRLSLLRLKPPRFDHLDAEKLKALGFEAQFAVDMIRKFAQVTPYPELSKPTLLDGALAMASKRISKLARKGSQSQFEQEPIFDDFVNVMTGRAGDLGTTAPISVHEHNDLEQMYQDYDMCWGEYLESVSMNGEKGEVEKLSQSLQPKQNIQPPSLENRQDEAKSISKFKLGEKSAKEAQEAQQFAQFDDEATMDLVGKGNNNNKIMHQHQLKLDLIPLLVLMHTKTFNTLFPEYAQAKNRGGGFKHRTQQQQQQEQQQSFGGHDGEQQPSSLPSVNFNNFKDYTTESTHGKPNPKSNTQLRKQQQDERLDAMLLGHQHPPQASNNNDEDDNYDEDYDLDFGDASPDSGAIPQQQAKIRQTEPTTTTTSTSPSINPKDARRLENFRHRSDRNPTELEREIELQRDEMTQLEDFRGHPTNGSYDARPIEDDIQFEIQFEEEPESQPLAVRLDHDHRKLHGDTLLADNLQPFNSERRYTSQGREESIDQAVFGDEAKDFLDESSTYASTHIHKSTTHLAPTRQSIDTLGLDNSSIEKFTLSDERLSGRDKAREKLHRFKGRGSQFHDMDGNNGFATGEDLGQFGTALNRQTNQILMDGMKGGVPVEPRATHHQYSIIDDIPQDQAQQFHAEQLKYVHKNKLQKQKVQDYRKGSLHEESELESELEFYRPDAKAAESVAETLHNVEEKIKHDTTKDKSVVGPAATDILVSSPTTPKQDRKARQTAGIESTVGLDDFKDEAGEFVMYGGDIEDLLGVLDGGVGVTSKPLPNARSKQIDATTIVDHREELRAAALEKQQAKIKKRKTAPLTEFESKWSAGQKKSAPTM